MLPLWRCGVLRSTRNATDAAVRFPSQSATARATGRRAGAAGKNAALLVLSCVITVPSRHALRLHPW